MAFDDGDADADSAEERPENQSNQSSNEDYDRVNSLNKIPTAQTIEKKEISPKLNKAKNSGNKTSRSYLRVRSNSSVFKTLNKTDSKVLDDP
jgi:hypothetical protein